MIGCESFDQFDLTNDDDTPHTSGDEADSDEEAVISNSLDWRDAHQSVPHQYLHMFRQGILTDCTLLVENEEIKTHRMVLARSSCVFEAMFSHEDTVEAKTGTVTIRDLTPRAVKLMLDFLYRDSIKLKRMEDALEVAMAAHMYQISRLLQLCLHFIIKLLAPANVWSALNLANYLNLQAVRQCCIEELQRNTRACICTEKTEFLQVSEDNIIMLLQFEMLDFRSDELTLVTAVIGWARKEALRRGLTEDDVGVRSVIEPQILPLLRLLLLPKKMFRAGSGFAGWLLSSERQKIFTIGHKNKPKNYCWPKTLSSETSKRNKQFGMLDHSKLNSLRDKHCVKRNVITTHANLKMNELETEGLSFHRRCSQCSTLFAGTLNHLFCHHSSLIFKVKSACNLFGLECSSRVSNDKSPQKYRETITVYLHCLGKTLTDDFDDLTYKLIGNFDRDAPFNSSIPVVCHEEDIRANKWYIIQVCYREFHHDPPLSIEYPNVTCPRRAVSSSNIKFVFHENPVPSTQPAPEESWADPVNSGLIRKLFVS